MGSRRNHGKELYFYIPSGVNSQQGTGSCRAGEAWQDWGALSYLEECIYIRAGEFRGSYFFKHHMLFVMVL